MASAIEVRNVSKHFKLYHEQYHTLKERLIFLGQRGRERSVECAHDRLRDVVVRGLAPELRAQLHRRLAATAVASGRDDPEFLARHLHAARGKCDASRHARSPTEIPCRR